MKVLLIGSGPNWKEAPFEDPEYEVWTYGLIADLLPRVDVVFEMHRRDRWEKFATKEPESYYIKRLNQLGKRIWMQEEYLDIPLSTRYPKEQIESLVGDQFFSTAAYQLGLACLQHKIDQDIEEILLFGLDLCTYEEWANQRPNVNRLIGFAQGMGIRVRVPSSSKLLGLPFSYGYEIPEENISAADALIIEGLAQLNSMMARLADLHIARKEALKLSKEKSREQSNHTTPIGEGDEGSLPRGEHLRNGEGDGQVPPGRNVSGGEEEMAGCKR